MDRVKLQPKKTRARDIAKGDIISTALTWAGAQGGHWWIVTKVEKIVGRKLIIERGSTVKGKDTINLMQFTMKIATGKHPKGYCKNWILARTLNHVTIRKGDSHGTEAVKTKKPTGQKSKGKKSNHKEGSIGPG